MERHYYALLLILLVAADFAFADTEPKGICRDKIDDFPDGTSCATEYLPTYYDLKLSNIEVSTVPFLKEHCCAFGGGEKVFDNHPVFEQLFKFSGTPISDYEDQHSPSQKALFWLLNEDTFPDLEEYARIVQRFALASIYFGLNGDTAWIECSGHADDTSCPIQNKTAWMSDQQECEWAYLSCDRNRFVTEINMPGNVGNTVTNVPIISPDIGLLGESLKKVNLRSNWIGGTIPSRIGSLFLLVLIDLSYNKLQGTLPDVLFQNATGLESVRVGHNSFNGTIKGLRLSQLKELNLGFNNFTGNISKVLEYVPKLANVTLLATSFTGVFPSDICYREIEDPSNVVRLECPMNCDILLENILVDDGYESKSNDCGGFGSGICIDYFNYSDDFGRGCDWYEEEALPGCPYQGRGTVWEACCYCGGGDCHTCYNTADKKCMNDDEWTASIDNERISCAWLEDNDKPGCPYMTLQLLSMDNVSDPRESCCHCSEYCQDLDGWTDDRSYGCTWYEIYDEPGCPFYGGKWSNSNGISAREACCYCREYDGISAPPVCYDYNEWVAATNYGDIDCEWYEYNDNPGCSWQGDWWPNVNNILAIDACCYCGGGWGHPSATPSYEYEPSTSPSVTLAPSSTPSIRPSHKFEPSAVPTSTPSIRPSHKFEPSTMPSVTCYDYVNFLLEGWMECFHVELWDSPGCPTFGEWYNVEDGISVNEACCYCGGGFKAIGIDHFDSKCDDNDGSWQNTVPTIYLPGDYQSCVVLEYYISILDEQSIIDSKSFYCNELHNGTVGMSEVCCICKPNLGSSKEKDVVNMIGDDESCIDNDLQIPKPWPDRNCEWFAVDAAIRCEEFGSSIKLIEGNDGSSKTANEVCCVCGGGRQECHEFNIDWVDSHPDEPYSCSDYDMNGRCEADGKGLISFGHNANTQCCVCGGGYSFETDVIISNATSEACLDEKDWQANGLTCSYFVDEQGAPDVEQCLALGHVSSNLGVNASMGCCNCRYGYDAKIGGGYRGMLLGKMFRIGLMKYTDISYVHNVTRSGNVIDDGNIYEFVRDAAKSYGFGLVLYDLKKLNETRALGRISNDPYYSCLTALGLSLLDLCIGPYKNSSFPPGTKTIASLYTEEYILVVREKSLDLLQYMLFPFAPFDYKTWIFVMGVILCLTSLHRLFALGLLRSRSFEELDVQSEEVLNPSSGKKLSYFLKKSVSIFFFSFTSFTSGSVETEMEADGSVPGSYIYVEKMIVIALSIFLFFTLLLYGGSTAAEFVNNPQGPEYKTIHDIFVENKTICFHNSLYGVMKRDYPTNTENFFDSSESDAERLLRLDDDEGCDGVVISRYSLSYLSTQTNSSCDTLYPLYDEELFAQDVVVPISQTLGKLGDELISVINIMNAKRLYRDKHDDSVSSLDEECEFTALISRKGVAWQTLFTPFIVSASLALSALLIGCVKFMHHRKVRQIESTLKTGNSETQEDVASLLNHENVMNKISTEIKQLNQDFEKRIMKEVAEDAKRNTKVMEQITRYFDDAKESKERQDITPFTVPDMPPFN